MNEKIVTCFCMSNGQTDFYPENTLTSFSNKLPTPLLFDKSGWEVGIKSVGVDLNIATTLLPVNSPALIILQSGVENVINPPPPESCLELPNSRWAVGSIVKYFMQLITNSRFHQKLQIRWFRARRRVVLSNSTQDTITFLLHTQLSELFNLEHAFTRNEFKRLTYNTEQYHLVNLKGGQRVYGDHLESDTHRNIPSILNVEADFIAYYNSDDKTSRIICSHSIAPENLNEYCCLTFKNPIYFNLLSEEIDKLNFRIVDGRGRQLKLFGGNASFLQLDFRKKTEMERQINMRVSSKPTHIQPLNKPAHFTANLHTPIEVPRQSKISLASVILPNKIATIPKFLEGKKCKVRVTQTWKVTQVGMDGTTVDKYAKKHNWFEFHLKPGYYIDNEAFINMLNEVLPITTATFVLEYGRYLKIKMKKVNELQDVIKSPFAEFAFRETTLVEISHLFHFPQEISRLFGFHSKEQFFTNGYLIIPSTNKDILFQEAILLHDYYPNYCMIYCDILKSSFLGGVYSPILHILPLKKSESEYSTYNIENENFVDLNTTFIDRITVKLTSHTGAVIDFVTDLDVILHFKVKYME